MRIYQILFIILCLAIIASCTKENEIAINELMLCGNNKVWIIDKDKSLNQKTKIIWQWENTDVYDQTPARYQKHLSTIAECKYVDNGTKILLAASSGGVILIERKTKKCLFYAYAPAAHSADLLPSNKIAVALSEHKEGNSIEIYDINRSEQVLFKDSLFSGHGSVWMENRDRYYALGYDELREYSLVDWNTEFPKLKLERAWTIPGESGHDLVPISDNELLLTENLGVHKFNIDEEKFEIFTPLHNIKGVKSANYNKESGEIIYTKSEISWWTHNIYIKNPDKRIIIPDIDIYKVRPNPF
ncbi:MAG: DUF6528 family protein [Parabacteroides sp.]|nr:DUF6528 family protein [Parabacteroides sp.]